MSKKEKIDVLEKKFQDFLMREKLEGKKILLAVSGGVDSRVLLEVAVAQIPKEHLAVCHINHKARKNSDADARFVADLCAKKGIRFFGYELKKISSKNQEAMWRTERKKCFKDVQKKFKAVRVLTAHHATDLVETMIFRLTKGAGPEGLSPFDLTTKPFADIPKSEIEKYAKAHRLKFVSDKTNDSLIHERNIIRHKVLPELRKITPNLEKVFVTESQIFGEIQHFLTQSTEKLALKKVIPVKEFLALSPILQKQFLKQKAGIPVSFDEVLDCLRWIESPKGGTKKKIGKTWMKKEKGMLHF